MMAREARYKNIVVGGDLYEKIGFGIKFFDCWFAIKSNDERG